MRFVMIGAAETIVAEIDGGATQKQVAQTYRLAMESMRHGESPDWKRINAAIVERWSLAGLVRVKKLAWSGKCFPPAGDRAAGAVGEKP
jgi:hypothetical protein